MRVLTLLSLLFVSGCGGSSDSSSGGGDDCEKAEIDLFTLTPMASAKGSLQADVTIKDQCDEEFYHSVFALKPDVVPANCEDGTVQLSNSTIAFFNGLESGKTYWVRACASLEGWRSEGASRMVVMP